MERRYYTFRQYLAGRFGGSVWKIPVHAGFTCPNRDGAIGSGGCIYCNNTAFFYDAHLDPVPIARQIRETRDRLIEKRGARRFLVYFQPYTNTYAPLDTLQSCYDQATAFPDVVGLVVGTRPDCVNEEILALLDSYADTRDVWIEYGLQSIHEKTLALINRGHGFGDFQHALEMTGRYRLHVCVHIILGLPGESRADMMRTLRAVSRMNIQSVKFHPLQILEGTELARMHRRFTVPTFSLDDYVELVCDAIEMMPQKMIIQRLVAESRPELVIAPAWRVKKPVILDKIDRTLERRDTYQGIHYTPE
ncbi:TIGR01212 family radical SAM protein [bacterium]|nr:TIGR01212 family radical SAM protein [bacterium]